MNRFERNLKHINYRDYKWNAFIHFEVVRKLNNHVSYDKAKLIFFAYLTEVLIFIKITKF